MRDIVTASYNHAPKSATLNRTEYKSYKDFVDNYGEKNSKDDAESVSSTDSGVSSYKESSNNTSTSSLNSDAAAVFSATTTGGNRTGSFRNYLDNYTSKKFCSVKPTIANKPNVTIKSEIVIQVGNPTTPKTVVSLQRPPTPPHPKLERAPSPKIHLASSPPLQQTNIPPPPPPPFPTQQTNIPPPPPIAGLLGCNASQQKKWATVETENGHASNNDQPKIPKSNMAAANLAKILQEHVLARRKISDAESPSPVLNGETCSALPRQASPRLAKKSPVLPKIPPSLPRGQPKSTTNGHHSSVDSVDYSTTTVVSVTDGSTTVDKGDPNVKKLVYNTYRGLLGAYNNKANDMISTLPRTMVREDKGVAKQVESISLQCRLDKLNGRINPKLEQE